MAGMFPIKENPNWNDSGQAIPIHSIDLNADDVLAMTRPCPLYEQLLKEYKNSPGIKSILDRNRILMQYLERHTGRKVRSIGEILLIYDVLSIEQLRNFQFVLPYFKFRCVLFKIPIDKMLSTGYRHGRMMYFTQEVTWKN